RPPEIPILRALRRGWPRRANHLPPWRSASWFQAITRDPSPGDSQRQHTSLGDLHDLLTIAALYTASGTYSIQPVTSRGWILVVDDQVDFAKHTAEILEFYGYQTSVAGSAAEALSVFTEKMDAVITDFRMTDGNGAELIAEMRRRGSRIPAVV